MLFAISVLLNGYIKAAKRSMTYGIKLVVWMAVGINQGLGRIVEVEPTPLNPGALRLLKATYQGPRLLSAGDAGHQPWFGVKVVKRR